MTVTQLLMYAIHAAEFRCIVQRLVVRVICGKWSDTQVVAGNFNHPPHKRSMAPSISRWLGVWLYRVQRNDKAYANMVGKN